MLFSMIPTDMSVKITTGELKAHDVCVYFAIDIHANVDTGIAWPSIATIAIEGGISTSTVKRSLKRLVATGYIGIQKRYVTGSKEYESNIYTLLFRSKENSGVSAQKTNVGSPRNEGLVPSDYEVGSDGAINHTHTTTTTEPYPPTPTGGTPPTAPEIESASDAEQDRPASAPSAAPNTKDPMAQKKNHSQSDGARRRLMIEHYVKLDNYFKEIWDAYPHHRKEGEEAARKEFRKLFSLECETEISAAKLIRIQKRIYKMCNEIETGERKVQFVPSLKNWLRDEDFSHD